MCVTIQLKKRTSHAESDEFRDQFREGLRKATNWDQDLEIVVRLCKKFQGFWKIKTYFVKIVELS